MILLQPTNPTPQSIYHTISGTIRYHERQSLPVIEDSLYQLCKYYEQTYNIDRDYLYTTLATKALTLILGDRYRIYCLLAYPKHETPAERAS